MLMETSTHETRNAASLPTLIKPRKHSPSFETRLEGITNVELYKKLWLARPYDVRWFKE